jgi:hypothetical protein
MRNCDFVVEQYRGEKLVRTFSPSGDDAHPWRMNVNGKSYLRTNGWMGLVEDTSNAGRGLAVHLESRSDKRTRREQGHWQGRLARAWSRTRSRVR